MSLLVIVPSRGRPQNAKRLVQAWEDTDARASLMFGIDDSDPTIEDYPVSGYEMVFKGHPTMIEKVNGVADLYKNHYDYLGFMGDDHLPKTLGWDRTIEATLDAQTPGIVYCNDLHQGGALPTAVFMHAEIVRALGWMALPTVEHLYCDNAWLDLGRALGSCTYLDHVIIEHLHPAAGKTESDEQYVRVNSEERNARDHAAWAEWRTSQLSEDVTSILAGSTK